MLRRLAVIACVLCLICGVVPRASAVEFVMNDDGGGVEPKSLPVPSLSTGNAEGFWHIDAEVPLPDVDGGTQADPAASAASPDAPHRAVREPAADAVMHGTDDPLAGWQYDDGAATEFLGPACHAQDCGGCPRCGRPRWFGDLWIAQGFTGNPSNPSNNSNLPQTFNDRANEYLMNQLYVSLGRRVQNSGGRWDWGGRVDLLYGSDYYFTQAIGLETREDGSPRWNSANGPRGTGAALYGLAMPQLYAEFYAPLGRGIHVKAGHFYSTLGYESVMAPENFFYSHSYARQYGQPFTHTGVLTDVGLTDTLSGHFAVTRGWDTWEDPNGKPGYLFGLNWVPSDIATLSATVHTGREDAAGQQDRTLYSIIYTRQITRALQYVLQHDFGMEANAELDNRFQPDSAKWYGLTNYFYLDLTERLTAGLRFEWFRDQDNARVLAIPLESQVTGGNYTQLTGGFNFRPSPRLVVRPEIRWDWSDVTTTANPNGGMYDNFTSQNQLTLATDIIFRY